MSRSGTRGFTLIELMCVIGLIGVLASIAIPNYTIYLARARETEALINVEAIAYLQQVRILELGRAIACEPVPQQVPEQPADFEPTDAWRDLGFRASGKVRFQYEVTTSGPRQFTVIARGITGSGGERTELTLDSTTMELERSTLAP